MTSEPKDQELARAQELLGFISNSPTAYHAVSESIRLLERAGFEPLSEEDIWSLSPGDRRYTTRNATTLVAFVVGQKPPPESGFKLIGAHTDSPHLKLKPRPGYQAHGYVQLGVEVYGGVLLPTWLDRDLSVAGRVAVLQDGQLTLRLVDLERPIGRVSNLAIHLNREVNQQGLKLNKQTHMPPIIGIASGEAPAISPLIERIARHLSVAPEQIAEHDLSLYDTQQGAIGGLEDEFIFSARLDNLASCHSALQALIEAPSSHSTQGIVLYDHEEVGSESAQGAAGPVLETALRRVVEATAPEAPQGYARATARSMMVSADMAHAIHPNYPDRHESHHQPAMGDGPVIKTNANQRYATDGESAARFIACCQAQGFTPQSFVVRTDMACGSTIGPISAARLGIKTVDVGNPMLSMHSVREMSCVKDHTLMHRALLAFLGSSPS